MSIDSSTAHRDPQSEYQGRLHALREAEIGYKQTSARLGVATLLFLAISLISAAWLLTSRISAIYWVLLPLGLLTFFAIFHERVIRTLRLCARRIAFYERGLARLGNKWMGTGETGDRFSDPAHPYARDLDIFGAGSLFELLCTARTRAGEETLAKWLLIPAAPQEVQRRNEALTELRTRVDLRQDLSVLGKDFRSGVQPQALVAWAEGASALNPGFLQILLFVLGLLWICSLIAWAAFDLRYPALLISIVNAGVASRFHQRASKSASAIEEAAHDLKLLSQVLARIEREKFSSSKLVSLHAVLQKEGVVSSQSIARLN